MFNRVKCTGTQNIDQVHSFFYCTFHKLVDMSFNKVIGLFVITAKHYHIWEFINKAAQLFKIPGRTPSPYENFHTEINFIQGFFFTETLMVGTDPCFNVFFKILSSHAGSMTVYRFAEFLSNRYFCHNFFITK